MVLSKDGISADETKVPTIERLKEPKNMAALINCLDLATYL